MVLPTGRLIRGRGLRHHARPSLVEPTFGLYLLGKHPPTFSWQSQWVKWRDFWLPSDPINARVSLRETWERLTTDRVEIACGGGRGRTGTALACIAVLDGIHANEAVAYVREHYDARAIETPWQRQYVERFTRD